MIKATFKSKRLTLEQKGLKKACGIVGKVIQDGVRRAMPRITGALYFSIKSKVKSDKEHNAFCVIGSMTRYSKLVGDLEKIPNKYIGKVNEAHHILEQFTGDATLNMLKDATRDQIAEMKRNAK